MSPNLHRRLTRASLHNHRVTIIFGQCNKITKTKIALGTNYAEDRQTRRLVEFLNQLHTVCFGSNSGGLSYALYKQVVAVKLLNNYSNNKPYDLHNFKEEIKIKYNVVKAITRKCSNGTVAMMVLLAAVAPVLD